MHSGEQKGRRTHSSSLRVPQDNSEITLRMQRSFSHYQVTEFLTHWTICPWEKASGKILELYSAFIQVSLLSCPLTSEQSPVFTILFQEVTLIAPSDDARLVSQKMPQEKLMILGGEETECLSS